MRTYARIDDNRVAEVLKTSVDVNTLFHPGLIWGDISLEPQVDVGWFYDGSSFSKPVARAPLVTRPSIPELQAQLEELRLKLLDHIRHQ